MNNIKPEDRPKLIGLVLAVLAVFGIGGVNILKMMGFFNPSPSSSTPTGTTAGTTAVAEVPTPAAAPGVSPTPAPAAAAPSQVANAVPANSPAPAVDGTIILPNLSNNPFRPIIVTATPTPAAPPLPPARSTTPAPASQPWVASRVAGAMPAFVPPSPGVQPAVVPHEDTMELVGVISGDSTMAMLRSGTQDQFVHVGERVGAFKVARIGTDDLTLRHGDTIRILRVGVPGVVEFKEAHAPAAKAAGLPLAQKRLQITTARHRRRGRHGSRWVTARPLHHAPPRPAALPQFARVEAAAAEEVAPSPVAPTPPPAVIVIPVTAPPAAPPAAPMPLPAGPPPAAEPTAPPASASPSPTPAPEQQPQPPVQDTGMPTPVEPQKPPEEKSEG